MAYFYNNRSQRWVNDTTGRFVKGQDVINEMRRIQEAMQGELDSLTTALYRGSITVQEWQISTASTIKDSHLAQSMFAVGGKRNMTAENYGRVGRTLRDEYGFLNQFAEDVSNGTQSEAQAKARIKQYGRATQQSYWREFANTTSGLIRWKLNPAEHCPDCLALAAGSPYTAQSLTTYPGAGKTRCRGNCKCELERIA